MKGVKVVKCITIDSFYICLFMAAVCPKDQKKLSLIMKKLIYRGFRAGCTQTQVCSVTYKTQLEFELHSGYMCLSYDYLKIKISHVGAQV